MTHPASTKVTLQNDSLTFAFSEPFEILTRLVHRHVEEVLRRIMHELRQDVLAALMEHWAFQHCLSKKSRKAIEKVRALKPDDVARVLLRECREVARIDDSKEGARVEIGFQRTLRIPDDGEVYPLPAGMGAFPLRDVDEFAERIPES